MSDSMPTNKEVLAQDIARLCNAAAMADAENDALMPPESYKAIVQAVLDELALIDSELQLNETVGQFAGRKPGELIEIQLREGETLAQAVTRLGL